MYYIVVYSLSIYLPFRICSRSFPTQNSLLLCCSLSASLSAQGQRQHGPDREWKRRSLFLCLAPGGIDGDNSMPGRLVDIRIPYGIYYTYIYMNLFSGWILIDVFIDVDGDISRTNSWGLGEYTNYWWMFMGFIYKPRSITGGASPCSFLAEYSTVLVDVPYLCGSVSKPCTPGEHQNSW